MPDHYVAARTALIRRGLPDAALRDLRHVRLTAIARLRPGADPRAIQADAIEQAKAIIHREVVVSLLAA